MIKVFAEFEILSCCVLGELEERVNFNALYELAKVSSNTNQGRPRHDEDNISIIELDTITVSEIKQ